MTRPASGRTPSATPGGIRLLLLQARRRADPVRREERSSFAWHCGLDVEQVIPFDLLEAVPRREHLEGMSGILVGGAGEFSCVDPDPPILRAIDFLVSLVDTQVPIFASCFGFQMLVRGLGGEVIRDEEAAQVGTCDLDLTPEGRHDPLFSRLPDPFSAQEGHKDRAHRVPGMAVVLATSPGCPYQAIRLRDRPVYATQFHPELDGDTNRTRFENYLRHYGHLLGEDTARTLREGFRPSPEASGLLRAFVEQICIPVPQRGRN